jgi:prepilin-type processing-associated H-X9-DG protein
MPRPNPAERESANERLLAMPSKAAVDCRTPRPGGIFQTPCPSRQRLGESALTLVELLVIVAIVAIMASLIGVPNSRDKAEAVRIQCLSNLKQIGIAFRVWEGDHDDHYPMTVYTNQFGGPMYITSTDMFRYFQAMSNEISNPQILICPADKKRETATNFTSDFNSSHISYFVGLDADETNSAAFLAGDSNITNGLPARNGLMELMTNQNVGWTRERHHEAGNVAMADGSVQQFSTPALNTASKHTGFATNRLLMPEETSSK